MGRLLERVAAAFDADMARVRPCGSSGSEYSPDESLTDLSKLVKSFIENEGKEEVNNEVINGEDNEEKHERQDKFLYKREMLRNLLDDNNSEDVKQEILAEAEEFCRVNENTASQEFKRQLMTHLRNKGFNAGLCKSRWERTGSLASGSYEFVDVYVSNNRYIVEVFLSRQFQIARPTTGYMSLLNIFPKVFVGKPEELKEIVINMCGAMKESLKNNDLKLAPWRRNQYMLAKWFGSYKRTTNAKSSNDNMGSRDEGSEFVAARRAVGFEAMKPKVSSYYCREDLGSNIGARTGYLTAAFSGNDVETIRSGGY